MRSARYRDALGPVQPGLILNACLAVRTRAMIGLLCVLLSAVTPHAARAVDMDVLVGFGQSATSGARYRPDAWTPLTVYLTGPGARGVGQLQVSVQINGHVTFYTRRVPLTEGAVNQAVNFAIQLHSADIYSMYSGGGAPEIEVRLLLDGRPLAGPKKVALPAAIAPETYNVLGLTRDGSGLNFLTRKKMGLVHRHYNPDNIMGGNVAGANGGESQNRGINPNATLQPLYTDPRALPALPQGYDAIDAIALADQPLDNLTQDQIDALQDYVRMGGLMIVSGGGDIARLRSEFFQEILPITRPQAVIVQALPELAARYGASLPLAGGAALAVGQLKPDAYVLFQDRAGRPLVSARPYGAGVVVFTAFDYLDRSIRAWQGEPALWRDLLRCGNDDVSPRDVLATSRQNTQSNSLRIEDALAGARASAAPPLIMLFAFCAAYLVLLVPVNYFVLKKLDRREMTWITAPILIAGFTLASYLFARSIKGGALTVNRALVVETQANSDQAMGYAQLTLYSPQRAAYDIAFGPPDQPDNPSRLYCPGELYVNNAQGVGSELTVDNDQTGTTLPNTLVRLWDQRSFDTPVAVSLGGRVDATTAFLPDGRHVKVTLTNNTRFALDHCALIGNDPPVDLGVLAPGASVTRTILWNWQHGTFSLPMSYSDKGDSPLSPTSDSPEDTRRRIADSVAQTLTGGVDQNQVNTFSGQSERGYGRAANAFVGWFNSRLLDVRVDNQEPSGQEVDLLLAHLPAPTYAQGARAGDLNPFAAPAVNNLEDETRPGAQGIFR